MVMVTSSLLSVLLGCLVSVIPNVVFKLTQARNSLPSAKQILRRVYIGELLKFGVLIFLAIVFLQWSQLNAKLFMAAFLLMEFIRLMCNWFKLLRVSR